MEAHSSSVEKQGAKTAPYPSRDRIDLDVVSEPPRGWIERFGSQVRHLNTPVVAILAVVMVVLIATKAEVGSPDVILAALGTILVLGVVGGVLERKRRNAPEVTGGAEGATPPSG